ncbi:MAG: sensor histidine kinase [Haloarculaceae archaeon]
MHVDITDRKLAELAVRDRNDELQTLASVLSHDVRNPLAAALSRTELLETEVDDGGAEHLDAIVSSLERIDTIIDDALVLARGGDPDDVATLELGAVAETAWRHVDTADATLELANPPTIDADEQLLMQLLENLFVNSVTHAGDDVTVTISATPAGFAVSDDGPGIDADAAEEIFDAGYTSNPEEGTGFGLAIVEKVADAHGWTVTVDPEADGAQFVIAIE